MRYSLPYLKYLTFFAERRPRSKPTGNSYLIKVNHKETGLRQQAQQRLTTQKGVYYRKQGPADVEPVFGNIKQNKNFKRFLLKGIVKTEIEWGLLCIAHNLKKSQLKSPNNRYFSNWLAIQSHKTYNTKKNT